MATIIFVIFVFFHLYMIKIFRAQTLKMGAITTDCTGPGSMGLPGVVLAWNIGVDMIASKQISGWP